MQIKSLIMGLVFALIWSSAFTSSRVIVAHAPPLGSLAIRFILGGLIGIGIAAALGQKIRLTRDTWLVVLVFGVAQNALYLGMNFTAMQWIEASLSAIIAATMPLIAAAIGWAFLGDRLTPAAVFGLALGVIGVAVIMAGRISDGSDVLGIALTMIAAVALAVATLVMRRVPAGGDLLMIVSLQMLVGALALAPVSLAFEEFTVDWTPQFIFAFSYTVLFPGLIGTWIWFALVRDIGTLRASVFHFLTPAFGVGIAAILLGENISALDAVGVVIVTIGIFIVQKSKQVPTKL